MADFHDLVRRGVDAFKRGSRSPRGSRKHQIAPQWDDFFAQWIAEAKRTGRDPNDIGDEAWKVESAAVAEEHYLPIVAPTSVVLELGPGTGRITRFVLPRCRHMILVDYSELVCAWLPSYFEGKGSFEVHHQVDPRLPMVADESVDTVIAHGVFEHFDTDEALWFLEEFARVLRPDGRVRLNYANIMSEGGVEFLYRYRVSPGHRNVFRFFHPEAMDHLAQLAGFSESRSRTSNERWAFLEAVR